jgi:hypothetical protein
MLLKYTSALLFTGINPSSERHRECFVGIVADFGIGNLVIIIYIGHYVLPIAYAIFNLTQRLVPVA